MNHPTTSPLPAPPTDAPVPGAAAGTGEAYPVAACAPTLTVSRGTRPLITRRPANGCLGERRRYF
ncbi:hypothetical protein KB206_19775 [Microvirga sp. STS02]|uniref:hypothetical protein n=1 Tax=Hymenobacter negativus TaxID=2795026 RepID=UPI0018DC02A7|nr:MULTISPECIES: hypothetical protein [Bacteria]MBH8571144.1 hypothetical protein [Hymenobacter negativus]MBR7210881.1 hypothetical protein [Microvirga sp. STS02]